MDKPSISGNTITIPSNLKYLVDVDEFIEGFLKNCEIEESVIADIAISVSELVNNAVAHGNKSSPDEPIVIAIRKTNGNITITVTDQGSGFDPDEIDSVADEASLSIPSVPYNCVLSSILSLIDKGFDQSAADVVYSQSYLGFFRKNIAYADR